MWAALRSAPACPHSHSHDDGDGHPGRQFHSLLLFLNIPHCHECIWTTAEVLRISCIPTFQESGGG